MAQFKLYLPLIKVNLDFASIMIIHALGAKGDPFVMDRSPAGRVKWLASTLLAEAQGKM